MNTVQPIKLQTNPMNYSMNSRTNSKPYAVSFNGYEKLKDGKDVAVGCLAGLALCVLIPMRNAFVKLFFSSKNDKINFVSGALESFEYQDNYEQSGEKESAEIIKYLDKYAVNKEQADFVKEGLEFIKNNSEALYNCHTFGRGWHMDEDGNTIINTMKIAMYSACDIGKCDKEQVNARIQKARELMKEISESKQSEQV